MHIEFLVEGPSDEAAVRELVPRILGSEVSFEAHVFQSKQDLLAKLPCRLRAYSYYMPDDWRIVVLVDEDRGDCKALKARLATATRKAGLCGSVRPRSGVRDAVLNRIAIEELEAWFLGDQEALVRAYPRVPPSLGQQAGYRDPDRINGGTWEALERVLRRAGYHRGGLNKLQAACDIAPHMDPERNRSHSFQVFVAGLRRIAGDTS